MRVPLPAALFLLLLLIPARTRGFTLQCGAHGSCMSSDAPDAPPAPVLCASLSRADTPPPPRADIGGKNRPGMSGLSKALPVRGTPVFIVDTSSQAGLSVGPKCNPLLRDCPDSLPVDYAGVLEEALKSARMRKANGCGKDLGSVRCESGEYFNRCKDYCR